MNDTRASARRRQPPNGRAGTVEIGEDWLELVPASAREVAIVRRWISRVNVRHALQPFLIEEPPGCFRLYLGESAERMRTRRGMVP